MFKKGLFLTLALGIGVGIGFGAALTLKDVVFSNTWSQGGYGVAGSDSFDGTFIVDRTGQRNGVADTGAEHPALWARTDMNNPASAFRASSKKGVDAVIGNTLPGGASPAFNADGTPTLFVGDTNLNTNGQKNGSSRVTQVALEARGAVKLCGKSRPGDAECTSQAYLFLEDSSGDLVVRFANGDTAVLASND